MRVNRIPMRFKTMATALYKAGNWSAFDGATVLHSKGGAAYVKVGSTTLVVKDYPAVGNNIDRYLMSGLA